MDSAGSAGLSLHEQNPQPQSHVHMGKLAQKIDHRKQLDIHHSFLGRGYSLYMAAIEDLTDPGELPDFELFAATNERLLDPQSSRAQRK